ncbi:MAG: alpha-2-macroglobulin family protein [Pseudomonadota bacterium]
MKYSSKCLIIFIFIFCLLRENPESLAQYDSAAFNENNRPLKITRITPSGKDVPAGRQIVFQFNRPVVPIGRMERTADEIPVNITPDPECQWRWMNTSALACQLGQENTLKKATHYNIVMKPGLTTEDGANLKEAVHHDFITVRPRVSYTRFENWHSPGTPVIRVIFNQSVSKSSVAEHLFFSYEDESGEQKELRNITIEADPDDKTPPRYIAVPGENYTLDFGESDPVKSDDDPRNLNGEEARRIWLVTPQTELPLDTSVDLKVEPGLISAHGDQSGIRKRTVVNFHTYPEFEFLGVSCTANDKQGFRVTGESDSEDQKCNPLRPVNLVFSAPVLASEIKDHIQVTPALDRGREDFDPWANRRDQSRLSYPHQQGRLYSVWLPPVLQAAESYHIRTPSATLSLKERVKSVFADVKGADLKDEFGRPLKAPIDIRFLTDHRPPNFELPYKTAVLEKQTDSDVPLYVNNLFASTFEHRTLTKAGQKTDQSALIDDIGLVTDIQYAVPMGIRDMLEGQSGAVYGTLSTAPEVLKGTYNHKLLAIVSPYQLHVKIGHYNTLVWVTDLKTGLPVKGARVEIYRDALEKLSAEVNTLDSSQTDNSGLAMLKGTQELDPDLSTFGWCNNSHNCPHLFVRIDKDDEMALLPLNNRFKINSYRASNNTVYTGQKKRYGHIDSWGMTAQGVYRTGDTIQYKFYVRDQDNKAYTPAPKGPYKLEIIDPTGKTVDEIEDLTLSEFGSYSGEYKLSNNAPVGWYRFKLHGEFADRSWQPIRVLVSDFTPASFKVTNRLNGDLFHPGDRVEVSSLAQLHSGGAYRDAETRITARLKKSVFSSDHPIASGFHFDSYKRQRTKTVFQETAMVNDQGEALQSFRLSKQPIVYGRLNVETAVRDDRGKYIAARSSADYISVDRLVGLKKTKWLYNAGEPADIKYLVVDTKGAPTPGTEVDLDITYLDTKAAKVKGAGNTYVTKFTDEWVDVDSCTGSPAETPETCSFTPEKPGTYKVTAKIKDTEGNTHNTDITLWVAGKGYVNWHTPNDNALQIVPEETDYNIGDTARYLIKNPYPGAQALISIERYGVLKSWVETLEGSTPVIEFEVEKDFMPGVYLSVVVTSPRVEAPPPKMGQIDLGKPAFKIGYVKIPVKDPYKQMDVTIKTNKDVYKPGEMVTAKLHAEPRHKDKQEDIEIAVVVLDEAVLDLIQGGKTYFDPYEGFHNLDRLDLKNYSLLTRLIGRQKFEKKGANAGGDGGSNISMRSLFKYVSYWNPSIKPDENGNATIDFEVPDNLTGWRVLAMAVTPSDRMGLGDTNFKVNLPTEIRPVMPNQVTEGDSFKAGFSVMNRTDRARDIEVTLTAEGTIEDTKSSLTRRLKLAPYKRETVFMPIQTAKVETERDIETGQIKFTATAKDEQDGDMLAHNLPVHKRRSLETAANHGTTTHDQVTEALKIPEKIHKDVGTVSVVLSPSVIGNIEGAFQYIRHYPYLSWEIKLSKAVMASHYQQLKPYLSEDLSWPSAETLPQKTLNQASDYQAPNGGMTYFKAQDKYVSPYLSAYTALGFNWLRDSGQTIPDTVEDDLHGYLENLLKKDAVPTFYSRGMTSTVRAVALAALAPHGKIDASDLERYQDHVKDMSLFGKAHFLMAAQSVENGEKHARSTVEMILAHATQSGGKFSFNTELDDSYSRILSTPLRANCAILSALTDYEQMPGGAEMVADIPFKLVRTITQTRGNRDHWENTQENMFCMNGLINYARQYEQETPNMKASVAIDQTEIGETDFTTQRDEAVTLERPLTAEDIGQKRQVKINRDGTGRLYYATRLSYAPLDDQAIRLNAGIDIRREYSVQRKDEWVLLDTPAEIKRGELVRVDLYVSLPTARNFVVIDDPVPGGLEPVNRDLANTSMVDADQGKFKAGGGSWWFQFDDWRHYNVSRWSFHHRELRHNAVRFYSDYLPAGNYHLSYTAQAIDISFFKSVVSHIIETSIA